MSRRTAVAAPAQPPYDELLAVIDRMTLVEVLRFTLRLRWRFLARLIEGGDL